MRYQIDIKKMANSLGFTIFYQMFERENILGYIYKGDINMIVVSEMEESKQRYIIADCLVHYLESEEKDIFYYESNQHIYDDYFVKLTADLLIPTKGLKKIMKRKNNQELSEYFNVPLFLIERKLLDFNSKVKRHVK